MKYLLTLLLLLTPLNSQSQTQSYYGAYHLYPQESTLILSMKEANTRLSYEVSAITYNPAGAAFAPWWGDLGGNYSTVTNLEADLNNDGVKDGIPYIYLY